MNVEREGYIVMNADEQQTAITTVAPPSIARIFGQFLRLGCTAFGGPAIIAHIREMSINRMKWIDSESFRDGVVLSQSLPGATAMQVAAYVGLKTRGFKGALAAYGGLGLPAFFLMLLLSAFYLSTRTIAPVVALFGGLQVIVVAVVAQAAYAFGKDIIKSARCVGLAVISTVLLIFKASPFLIIIGSACAGAVLFRDLAVAETPAKAHDTTLVKRTIMVSLLAGLVGGLLLYFFSPGLLILSALMVRINFFAFGGGLSSLPLMHHEVISRGWMDSTAFMDGIALGQVTPGPISITGTFIGYLLFGFTGAVVATVATFAPSFILLLVSEPYFEKLKTSQFFARASKGIVSCFVGLLVYVAYSFASGIHWDVARLFLVAAALVALLRKVDILLVVVVGAIFSVVLL